VPDLEKVRSAGKHLLQLINDVLDLSKIESGKVDLHLELVDLQAMIRDVTETLGPLVAKNQNRLELHVDDDLPLMRSDVTKLRQCLFNLLSNANKFTQAGTITLTVTRRALGPVEDVAFRVADTGIGMSEEQLAKLFQAFSQADPSITRRYGGTGLGLAISRQFCRLLGGDIEVESAPGEGSTFTMVVPIAGAPSA
jgi:signal transduction histidine kinase